MKRITLFISIALVLLVPLMMLAGNIDSPADLGQPGSAMYTLLDIFNLLDSGTEATKSDAFDEPGAGPASTGKTLDEVYARALTSARVPKTGQTTSYSATGGEDGDLQKGVDWPTTRFSDNSDGTVTDNLTGLIWLKNANAFGGTRTWEQALTDCNTLNSGEAGLTDGSVEGDWRLPNYFELLSLIDVAFYSPALSNAAGTAKWTEGDPFTGVRSLHYWSSSTSAGTTTYAWLVHLDSGDVNSGLKTNTYDVWPVRGGQ
jgi:hypothetical protein